MSKHRTGNKEAKQPKREPAPALAQPLPPSGTPVPTAPPGARPAKRK